MSTGHDSDEADASKPFWLMSQEMEEEIGAKVEADVWGNQGDDEDMEYDSDASQMTWGMLGTAPLVPPRTALMMAGTH